MRGRVGLNGLNFVIAAIQAGFGPFIAVWLTQNGWNLASIGFALSLGTFAQMAAQVPAGWTVDHIHRKRYATAAALIGLGLAGMLLAMTPSRTTIWTAELLHAGASAVLTPALAALTLTLCGHGGFGSRLGVNARYASLGAAASAALLGIAASETSNRSVFLLTALLVIPAFGLLLLIPSVDTAGEDADHSALLRPHDREQPAWSIFQVPALHIFAVAVALFQLANAALLPVMLSSLAQRGDAPGYVVSVTVIVPQIVVALFSPWFGSLTERVGRRPLLLLGFAAVPLRAVLFATLPAAVPMMVFQALDGVSAAVFGLMLPLIAADVTKDSGYLNLAIGSLGLASSLGATFSTVLAGLVASHLGNPVAFIFLAVAGGASVALLIIAMPETRPARRIDVENATLVA